MTYIAIFLNRTGLHFVNFLFGCGYIFVCTIASQPCMIQSQRFTLTGTRSVGSRKGAIGIPVYAPGHNLFQATDHCNPVPIVSVHCSAAGIVFNLSVCLSVDRFCHNNSITTMPHSLSCRHRLWQELLQKKFCVVCLFVWLRKDFVSEDRWQSWNSKGV